MAVYDSIRINEGGNILKGSFRNFSARPFRGQSRITFCVELKDDDPNMFYGDEPLDIQKLIDDGWNIKTIVPSNEDEEPVNYIQVNVQYTRRDGSPVNNPPRVVITDDSGKDELNENSIHELDEDNIVDARMIIRPYEYEPGKVSAKLKTLFVRVDGKIHKEDELEDF